MIFERSSGVLMHITSLPSSFGIGDLGPSAYKFADFLELAGKRYWQVLPLNPTELGAGNSPYSSPSAFAGNTLLISPDFMVRDGFLLMEDVVYSDPFGNKAVNFPYVVNFKHHILNQAFQNFKDKGIQNEKYRQFCAENLNWLNDYALFVAVRKSLDYKSWMEWPPELRDRDKKALNEIKEKLSDDIEKEKFLQFVFYDQWENLNNYCKSKGIQFIGDIPYYVSYDSADVWAHTKYFKLDQDKKPTGVSGVPPDYFSETGQLWGTPVYDWKALKKENFSWWIDRIRQNLKLCDVVRIDHFRAFSAYWEVPAGHTTAIEGKWVPCPGGDLFNVLKKEFPEMPFIAEDLGILDQGVYDLIETFRLPGMKVLMFAFGEDMNKNPYIPHHHIQNCVVYTGTHDNNTVKGWFDNAPAEDRRRLTIYAGRPVTSNNVNEIMQRLALMSVARLVVLPLQDVLGLGEESIMNRPSTGNGNWTWRLPYGQLTEALALKLKLLNQLYDR